MTVEAAPAQPFVHSGKFFNVLGLALKNAALTVLTLTLYRFWARTAMRRRLWSRASVSGDPLEYSGTSAELFRGFLIALPTFFLPAMFVFYIAPLLMDPVTAFWLGAGFYLIAVPLMAAARYLMRRYQLARTRWRGIRMGLAGSAASFAWASFGWTILQMLSLGWYTPVARMNRAKLMWENTRFGDQPFEFTEDGHPPQRGLWWPFAFGWVGFGAASVGGFIALSFFIGTANDGEGADPAYIGLLALAWIGACAVAWLVCWAPYNAAAMNRIASLIAIDGARFQLKARTISLFVITLAGWFILIPSLTLLAPMAGFLQVRYVLCRLHIIGAPKFSEIGQSIVEEGKAGESLGDAFDLDMGVGVL
ncbi:MAG: DUF898 family protein [Phycisphaerales bacterium]|nr:DUF898 family protein [Hyphomonadaceae bacterium]